MAASNICGWIHAVVEYFEKMKIVRPKQKTLKDAEEMLA
jgi:citrate synthase